MIVVAAAAAGLTAATCASAETAPHRHKDKTQAAAMAHRRAPELAPGVELRASTYASPGSENHYYSDTVASSHSDLMDMTHRYGQSTAPEYNSSEPLFQF
jgi:hypothetical protein